MSVPTASLATPIVVFFIPIFIKNFFLFPAPDLKHIEGKVCVLFTNMVLDIE